MSDRPDVPQGEPWEVPAGRGPEFGRRSSVQHLVQRWYDHTRHRDRILRFMGRCVVCLIPAWRFDDGENDPRGVLGDHAYWATGLVYRGVEYEICTCATCANDHDKYLRALRVAQDELDARRSKRPGQYRAAKIRRVR